MTPERHEQVKKIFLAACEVAEADRPGLLDEACGGDAELRREVESLLLHHNPATIIAPHGAAGPISQDAPPTGSGTTGVMTTGQAGSRTEAAPRFVPGALVADRYRIVSLLGRGGMGEVYRAEDLKLHQTVALKFIWGGLAADPAKRARFLNEVRLARSITHPNICRIHDIGEAEGEAFISMEYVDGEDLASLLRRIGRLPRDKAIQIAWQVCASLGAVHRQGVLHRDLKPANIMLDGKGNVRVTDFGIAVAVDQTGKPGFAAGTFGYMAPEVLAGQPASERSDIYALGLVLYEVVTGRPAIDPAGRSPILLSPPDSPSRWSNDVDPVLESVILRCLEPDPNDRPASVAAVASSLPGGDSLTAVLAAGETPSPDVVAGARIAGMARWAVFTCLTLSLVGLVAIVLLADRSFLLSGGFLKDAPAVLEYKAKTICEQLGRTTGTAGRSHGFVVDLDDLEFRRRNQTGSPQGETPSGIYFEYRQGERLTTLTGPLAVPTLAEVPFPEENIKVVRLGPSGQLLTYVFVPASQTTPGSGGLGPPWQKAFEFAGLDLARFREVAPSRTPPIYADTNLAWESLEEPDRASAIRVEAASADNQIVYFHVRRPWQTESPLGSAVPRQWTVSSVVIYIFFFTAGVAGVVLAYRNLRQARGDRRGAWRIAVFMLIMSLLMRMFRQPPMSDSFAYVGWTILNLRFAVFSGAVIWLWYLAIEPYVRRFWPQSLIAWSKLLAGRIGEPAIWRDVLIGTVSGIGITLLHQINTLLVLWSGFPAALPLMPLNRFELGLLVGFRSELSVLASSLVLAIWVGLLFVLIMLILRVSLRSPFLAACAFVGVAAAVLTVTSAEVPVQTLVMNLITAVGLSIILMRVGLLAGVVCLFVNLLVTSCPMTSQAGSWFAGPTLFVLTVVALLLLLGVLRGRQYARRLHEAGPGA